MSLTLERGKGRVKKVSDAKVVLFKSVESRLGVCMSLMLEREKERENKVSGVWIDARLD